MKKVSGTQDPTREHLNFEIGRDGIVKEVDKDTSIPTRIREILKARGITDPNAGLSEDDPRRRRTVANIILEGSRDVMRQLAFGNQEVNFKRGSDNSQVTRCPGIEKWAQDMYHFMADKYDLTILRSHAAQELRSGHRTCIISWPTNTVRITLRHL